MATRMTRINPRTGQVERPWKNREGFFVLGDSAHGAQKHHDKYAVKVTTLEEAVDLVGRGFSLRMTDGETPPSLIAPESLTIVQVEDTDPTPLWNEMLPKPPFTKEDMMAELRMALLVQANQIAHAGSLTFAEVFMGFETSNPLYPYCEDDPAKVDLKRFAATGYLDLAYDHAFQVGQYWCFGDEAAQDVNEFIAGANGQASSGDRSPLADPDSLCRLAADTAFGRWSLEQGSDPSIRELALLGQMKESAVRNSLSKERIAIDRGRISHTIALDWLRQRRDFTPTRTAEAQQTRWMAMSRWKLERSDFAKVFNDVLLGYPIGADELARKANVSPGFIGALLAGRPERDLDALLRVGASLDLDAPHFAGVAVQAALQDG
jgi:hypothetical protein